MTPRPERAARAPRHDEETAAGRDLRSGVALQRDATRGRTDASWAPEVRRSVINSAADALGTRATSLDIPTLERDIRQSILDFEPRILPASLRVTALLQADQLDHHNVIGVQIQGQLWAEPVPLELLLRTEIDLETGRVELSDLLPSRGV